MANTEKLGQYATTARPMPGGAIYFAEYDESATLPTGATSAITGFDSLGEMNEDGLAQNTSLSTSGIKGWSGVEVISTMDEYSNSYSFAPMEVRATALAMIWGTEDGDDGAAISFDETPAGFDKIYSVIAIMLLEDGRIWRKVIPRAKITNLNTINYKRGEAVTMPIEIKALAGGFADNELATCRNYISAPDTYTDGMKSPSFSSASSSSSNAGSNTGGSSTNNVTPTDSGDGE